MDKSDIQEALVLLYLRLNGYFASGFIVHDSQGCKTEMDVLAVRFARHREPEREVQPCPRLDVPLKHTDLIVGEVKGGTRNVNFNSRFREDPDSIRAVLNRFGTFDDGEIDSICARLPALLRPNEMRRARTCPALDVCGGTAKLRFVLFAPEQQKRPNDTRPYIFENDLVGFAWTCFRPQRRREMCDTSYNYALWGPLFEPIVRHFKDPELSSPGTIDDLYKRFERCGE